MLVALTSAVYLRGEHEGLVTRCVRRGRCSHVVTCLHEQERERNTLYVLVGQEKEAFEQQKKEAWVPSLGSMVFVPRMKGKFKVGLFLGSSFCVLTFKWSRCCMQKFAVFKRPQFTALVISCWGLKAVGLCPRWWGSIITK